MSAVVFLLVCFLSCSVSEEPQEHVIIADPGDDVTLPGRAPNNIIIAAVVWSRPDLEKHVYLKEGGHLNTADQDPSYVNRVQLKDDEMKDGELSLILKNVTNNDEGGYVCWCGEEGGGYDRIKFISIVYLNVTGGDPEDGKDSEDGQLEVILPVILIAALVVAVDLVCLVGFVIYKKRKGRSEKKPDLPVDDSDVLQPL